MSLYTDITKNEMNFVLTIFKSPKTEFNANSISKHLKISAMGSLKIAKKLEKERIIISKQLGKAKFYRLNLENDYVREYVKFLLKREKEQAHSFVKVWIDETRKIKSADSAILFGSVLRKHQDAEDIDVVFVTDEKKLSRLKKEIDEINKLNIKPLHPIFQTKQDFINNLKKDDKIILEAIKGILVFGEDFLIEALQK